MALITCPECSKSISDQAKTCPHCGCPNTYKQCPECKTAVVKMGSPCKECGYPVDGMSSGLTENTTKAPTPVDNDEKFSFGKALIGMLFGGAIGTALGIKWGLGPVFATFISLLCAAGCGLNNWLTTFNVIVVGTISAFVILIISIFQ